MSIKNFFLLDLETLGRDSNAPIIQVGAVTVHNLQIVDRLVHTINFEELSDYPLLKPDYSTIKWWMEQSNSARQSVIDGGYYTLQEVMEELNEFLRGSLPIFQHSSFDAPKVAFHNKMLGIKPSYHYTAWTDIRSMNLLLPEVKLGRKGEHHTALADAEFQANVLIEQFKTL